MRIFLQERFQNRFRHRLQNRLRHHFHFRLTASFCLVGCLLSGLAGCIPPPKDDGVSGKRSAPVQSPNAMPPAPKSSTPKTTTKPAITSRAEEKQLKKNQRPQGLPAGWTIIDPKGIVLRVEQEPQSQSVVLFTKADAGLEVVGARDMSKQERYRGKLDGGHLIALSPPSEKVLVLFSNRQNAKFSVLLTTQQSQ